MTINELQRLRESEDKVEFKEAKNNFPYNGGSHKEQESRKKCYLGYIGKNGQIDHPDSE